MSSARNVRNADEVKSFPLVYARGICRRVAQMEGQRLAPGRFSGFGKVVLD